MLQWPTLTCQFTCPQRCQVSAAACREVGLAICGGSFLELPMAPRKAIETGTVFGKLKVLRPVEGLGKSQSLCRCECGRDIVAINERLKSGKKQSCGCMRMKTHKLGTRFGRLVVVEFCGTDAHGHSLSRCRCDCGKEIVVVNGALTAGNKKSCGCLAKDNPPPVNRTHGRSKEGVYKVWCQMWQRCTNKKVINYHIYGGKGIQVCDRWKDFALFADDMGPRPDGYTVERRESSGDYEPSNCYWATRTDQNNNTSRNRHVTIGDRTMTVSQWARETGLHKSTITARLNRGVSGEDLLCVR